MVIAEALVAFEHKSFAPDNTMKNTGSRKAIVASVKEMATELFGSEGDGWQK